MIYMIMFDAVLAGRIKWMNTEKALPKLITSDRTRVKVLLLQQGISLRRSPIDFKGRRSEGEVDRKWSSNNQAVS